ncbi:MAG: hypothetical protein JO259_15825 [Mycobacterium sp.]|nr:hypothetical protein [Mycobacterium sp.]
MIDPASSSGTQILAAADLFTTGTSLAYSVEGFLAVLALVMGSVATIHKHGREGAGAGITSQIGTIVLAVLIFLSSGIAAVVTHEFNNHGIRNSVHVPNPWGQ